MESRPSPLVGAHIRVGSGLATGGLRYAEAVGAETVQVFVGNPRGWALPPGVPEEDRAFRIHTERRGCPVFVHAAYLINLASPDRDTALRSDAALRHALSRGRDIGASGVVVHAGSAVRAGRRDAAMRQVRDFLLPVLEDFERGPDLLLEPMAGQGQALCAKVGDLGPYLAALEDHPRARVCLDTCHAFAAGHDLAAPGGMPALLDAMAADVGLDRLGLVHANDSLDARGSFRDRHANIGVGTIGESPFAELLASLPPGVPVIVETPGGVSGHRRDIETLKRLRGAVARVWASRG